MSIEIPQGLFLSLILFLFYNALLFKDLKIVRFILAASFIDDIVILREKKIYKKNFIILHNFHEKICKS